MTPILREIPLKRDVLRVTVMAVCLVGAGLPSITQSQTGQNTTTQFAYDAQGNVTQITDPRGLVTARSFDALNRLVRILQPPPISGAANPASMISYDGR